MARNPFSIVEARIRAAEAAGAFEHLPGKGKPLPEDPADGLSGQERFEVLLARSIDAVPEEVLLLREIAALREKDDPASRKLLAEKQLRLTMLHEANGRNVSARLLGEK
jgi:hypothetical protein